MPPKNKFEFDFSSDEEKNSKSPKKAKLDSEDNTSKLTKRKWEPDEEADFIECINDMITAGMSKTIKAYPRLQARSVTGCMRHWTSLRRKLETAVLGAPTVDKNGKKLVQKDEHKTDTEV
ncbi:hypothetical protein BCV70DRAFT_236727 [Testicularia cyperi]|uniref:Myb-like domain-containing protein n=1 Tax=Testicularia cyperi TaxID=1882483 RepID=A0A317XSK6_9BASI|nr:hypothetical protein BCV70DRAFT_236727 [Testicularia cyperi]